MNKITSYFPLSIALIVAAGAIFYFLTAENIFFFGEKKSAPLHKVLPDVTSKVTPTEGGESSPEVLPVAPPATSKIISPEIKPKVKPVQEIVREEPITEELPPQIYTVSIEAGGFNPRIAVIKAGDTVRWVNNDSKLHWPASDPHPTHTGLAGFDPLADLRPGESFSFKFNDPGIYGYHDHTQAVVSGIATLTGIVRVLAP